MPSQIQIMDYDPLWPELFRREADQLRFLLGCRALQIEHTGSTSVPDLAAKPITDILLVVADSSDEPAYVPILEHAGYSLRIREPNWHEHRMVKGPLRTSTFTFFLVAVLKSIAFYIFGTGCVASRRSRSLRTNQTELGRKGMGGCPGLRRCQDRGHSGSPCTNSSKVLIRRQTPARL